MISACLNADDIRRYIDTVEETMESAYNLQNIADAVLHEADSRIQREATAYAKSINDCKKVHAVATAKIVKINLKIGEIKVKIGAITRKLSTIKAELLVLQGKRAALMAAALTSPVQAAIAIKEIAKLKSAIDVLCRERDGLQSKLASLRTEIDDLYCKRDTFKEACDELTEEQESVKNSLERLQSLIDELQDVEARLVEILDKLIKRTDMALPELQKADRAIRCYLEVRISELGSGSPESPVNFVAGDEIKKMGMSPAEYKTAQEKTGYSHAILKYCRTLQEAEYYFGLGLIEGVVGGRPALIQPRLDFNKRVLNLATQEYETNSDRMNRGQAPVSESGELVELHHIGQYPDSPFAELPTTQHRLGENYAILHTSVYEKSKINREVFAIKERVPYWKARAQAKGENYE